MQAEAQAREKLLEAISLRQRQDRESWIEKAKRFIPRELQKLDDYPDLILLGRCLIYLEVFIIALGLLLLALLLLVVLLPLLLAAVLLATILLCVG